MDNSEYRQEDKQNSKLTENVAKRSPHLFYRIVRGILLSLLALSLCVAVLAIAVFEYQPLRQFVLKKALAILNAELDGHINVEDLEFHWFDGLFLRNIVIATQRGDTALTASSLSIAFDPSMLLSKTISAHCIVLEDMHASMLRGTDSVWNIERIFRPSSDTSSAQPFDWDIVLGGLEIRRGAVVRYDSLFTAPPYTTAFCPERMHLEGVSATISGKANIAKRQFSVTADNIAFADVFSSFSVNHLALTASVNSEAAHADEIILETPKTSLKLSAHIPSNIFQGFSPDTTQLLISLEAERFGAEDLAAFLPYSEIRGSYQLSIDASGTLNNLVFNRIEAATSRSKLIARGNVHNLEKGENLTFSAWISPSVIAYDEIRENAPVLQLPILNFLGSARLQSTYIYGAPDDSIHIETENIATKMGQAGGVLTLMLRDTLGYRGALRCNGINLGILTGDSALTSNLNGAVSIAGQGLDLQELATKCAVELRDSQFAGRHIGKLAASCAVFEGGIIVLDSLHFVDAIAENDSIDDFDVESVQRISAKGRFDLRNFDMPEYDFSMDYSDLDIGYWSKNPELKLLIDGNIAAKGKGFHPDSVEGRASAKFTKFLMEDRALVSFDASVNIVRLSPEERIFHLQSNIMDVEIKGQYRFASIYDRVASTVEAVVETAAERVNKAKGKHQSDAQNSISLTQIEPNNKTARRNNPSEKLVGPTQEEFMPINATIRAKFKELSPLNIVFDNINISSKGDLSGSLTSDRFSSQLTLDTVNIAYLSFTSHDIDIQSEPLHFGVKGTLDFDEHNKKRLRALYASVHCDSTISINDITLRSSAIYCDYRDSVAKFQMKSSMNSIVAVQSVGQLSFVDSAMYADFDSLAVQYGGKMWTGNSSKLLLTPSGLKFLDFSLSRENAETMLLKGMVSPESFSDLQLHIRDFPLNDLHTFPFMPESTAEALKSLRGKIEALVIDMDGDMKNPSAKLNGKISAIKYNGVVVGDQTLSLTCEDSTIVGNTAVFNSSLPGNPQTLMAEIRSLPISIAIAPREERLSASRLLSIQGYAKKMSLAAVAPFIPGITKFQGLGDAEISVEGIVGKNINYIGKANFYKSSFVTLSTNIKYYAAGALTLKNNTVFIDSIKVYNDPADLRGGRAVVSGSATVDGFDIKYFDLLLRSPKLLVLSPASEVTLPTMYGNLEIASGVNPLHVYGTLESPNIGGDVDILKADIIMPPDKKLQKRTSFFHYENITENNKHIAKITAEVESDSTNENKDNNQIENLSASRKIKASLTDKMRYGVNVRIRGQQFKLTLILGDFEKLSADIEPRDRNVPLRFEREPFGPFQLFGEMLVKNTSRYEFIKTLNAEGNINFSTGQIDNPQLKLQSKYEGSRTFDGKRQNYTVTVLIEGTKKTPSVKFVYEVDGVEGAGSPEEITENAIMLLVFGRTKSELFGSSAGGQGSLAEDITGSASSLLSGPLASLFQGTIIREANINFNGGLGDLSQANINLSGQLIGDVIWRVGGTVGDLSSNNHFSIDIPLSVFWDKDLLDNVVLQLTTSAGATNASSNISRQQKWWEVKLGWRYSF